MKALLLVAITVVLVLACSGPDLSTPLFQGDPNKASPVRYKGLRDIVEDRLKATVGDSGRNCFELMLEGPGDPVTFGVEYHGDRTWTVTQWHYMSEQTGKPIDPLIWKVRELSATTAEVVDSPDWLEDLGCG